MMRKLALVMGLAGLVGLSSCTDPYDPGQRALGGAGIGAGTGAILGAATTPTPPPPGYYPPPPQGYPPPPPPGYQPPPPGY